MPFKLAILASGSGTNAARIITLCKEGKIQAEAALLISNRPEAKALERAAALGVPVCAMDHNSSADRRAFDLSMVEKLRQADCNLIVLAGYMRLLTREFLDAFPGQVINIHPALLPSFPGTHGARDALGYGVRISGATAHYVEEEMDSGPVIIQAAVPVNAGESAEDLQNRIHAAEYKIYPQAIQWIAQGRLRREGRQVFLKERSANDDRPPSLKRQGLKPQFEENILIWPPLEEDF